MLLLAVEAEIESGQIYMERPSLLMMLLRGFSSEQKLNERGQLRKAKEFEAQNFRQEE